MSYYAVKVSVFAKETGKSVSDVWVSLSLSGFEAKTDDKGEVKFKVPSNSGEIHVYINGTHAISGYPYDLNNVMVYVTSGKYFDSLV